MTCINIDFKYLSIQQCQRELQSKYKNTVISDGERLNTETRGFKLLSSGFP